MPRLIRQAAVLAMRERQLCMVTSRNGRRWVIPKGQIERHQTEADAAQAEAWEEAGIMGQVGTAPLGTFEYAKNGSKHHVVVFSMDVTIEREKWPECHFRKREWVPVEVALLRIEEPDLRKLVMQSVGIEPPEVPFPEAEKVAEPLGG
jgi:8-oxo-dGTP pyrophosphatase MutT (NUDIX family)